MTSVLQVLPEICYFGRLVCYKNFEPYSGPFLSDLLACVGNGLGLRLIFWVVVWALFGICLKMSWKNHGNPIQCIEFK